MEGKTMTQTYEEFETRCDILMSRVSGLGIHDLADARWRDYFEEGLSPLAALRQANEDSWDSEMDAVLGAVLMPRTE
tara:strand:+ start:718 stop:948 length:231 start_codon:yes stop_codon:yes gene_type:complete